MRYSLSQPDSEDGTVLIIEATHDDFAIDVATALIRGGFFEKERQVRILAWLSDGHGWTEVSNIMICQKSSASR